MEDASGDLQMPRPGLMKVCLLTITPLSVQRNQMRTRKPHRISQHYAPLSSRWPPCGIADARQEAAPKSSLQRRQVQLRHRGRPGYSSSKHQINLGGIGTVSTAQAGSLTTRGVPNDLLSKANPIVVLAATPTMLYIINPFLQRRKIRFDKIRRLTLGFTLSLCSALSGALLQWRTTAYEIAYDASPDMKALVTALYFASMALSAAAGQVVGPAMHDPDLVWIWAVPGMIGLVQTVVFWFQYRHMDQEAEYTPGVVERKDSQ